jgi:hypothetical protein
MTIFIRCCGNLPLCCHYVSTLSDWHTCRRGGRVGCCLDQLQTQEQHEVEDNISNYSWDKYLMKKMAPDPDVMDDDDCTAIPLQIHCLPSRGASLARDEAEPCP